MSLVNFDEFLNKVTSRIKSKEAHSFIKKELTNHLKELSESFQKRGIPKKEAHEMAIQSMGNPFTIGERLNRIHRPKMDWFLVSLFIIIASSSFLLLLGGIPGISLSGATYLVRQAIWYGIAFAVILSFLFFDYSKLKDWWGCLYLSGVGLLIYTLLFGTYIQGMIRWISVGPIMVDSSILSLFLFFIAWAGIMSNINNFSSLRKQALLVMMAWVPVILFALMPHYIFSIIYICFVLTMFAFSHVEKKIALTFAGANITIGMLVPAAILISSRDVYFYYRFSAFFDPSSDQLGLGYMYIIVREVLSNAGWFGNGFTRDVNIQSLPGLHTDFAFIYLVYTMGWLFGIFLCLILLLFIFRISFNAFRTKDMFGRLLVLGGAVLFTVPACWNILMGLGIVPIIGISLPLVSYGGLMLMLYAAVLGLILNVYRRKDIVETSMHYTSSRK
ncbi:FtsW/RodA/SpoVE family cell cycle protein [Evansella clarkii]|uniref:FtsW/RodA/SpoVE family cell cycle protein n=1 Tax=Evansella clarkii TaxID=79879 RepID=UPI0009986C68|nr:FtsW/RodA/SpoVE family cell cycle protein [Evansella clarkii]